ncbi:MAG: polysaccharide lyase family protein, partial [Candidatus Hydrogenedentales bacterium]
MRTRAIAAILGLGVLLSGAAAADTLWSVGRVDGDYGEFALVGAYADFSTAFPGDVTYKPGSDSARKNWPFIQPGPEDAWAGSKPHPYSVNFNLRKAPKSACRLMVHLCDTHQSAPVLAVNVNGHECEPVQLPGGAGDGSLTDAKAGRRHAQAFVFPGDWLSRGKNTVTLTTTSGSWMLYDALVLESGLPTTPQVSRMTASCTPMFKNVDGVLKQAVRVEIENNGLEGEGQVQIVDLPGTEQTVVIKQGTQVYHVLVPPFAQEETLRVKLTVGDKAEEAAFDAKPEKQYQL